MIETLSLRKLEPADLPYLYRWENDAAAWPDGANHHPLSQQDLRDYIASTTGDIYRDGQLRLIICLANAGAEPVSVGAVDLYDLDVRNRKAAVAIYIDEAFRRRQLATEALKQLTDLAFRHIGLRMLYATVGEHNLPSQALFLRAGFARTALLSAWTNEGDASLFQKFS